jgi:hypothetical protein
MQQARNTVDRRPDPTDYGNWKFRVQTVRREADPVRLNYFIVQQLSPGIETKAAKMVPVRDMNTSQTVIITAVSTIGGSGFGTVCVNF